jgi:hypothetical protein
LIEIKKSGFELKEAKVNFIVYMEKEDTEQEVKIILPELYFERLTNCLNAYHLKAIVVCGEAPGASSYQQQK